VKSSPVRPQRRTGVCVVRAEPQGTGLLFSVTGNTDVERRTVTQVYGHAGDVQGTLELVWSFLQDVKDLNTLDQHASTYLPDEDDSP
jgi:hypothetical protein